MIVHEWITSTDDTNSFYRYTCKSLGEFIYESVLFIFVWRESNAEKIILIAGKVFKLIQLFSI